MALTFLQEAELSIYKHLSPVLREHNLRFFAMGGTLLGAVRHKGFIPWDDDIDIVLPRPDYDRFLALGPHALGNDYTVVSFANSTDTPAFARYFCKVHDKKTPIVEKTGAIPEYTTAWIDVFPLDPLPSSTIIRQLHTLKLRKAKLDVKLSSFEYAVNVRRQRPWYQNVALKLLQLSKIGANKDTRELLAKTEQLATSLNYDKEDLIVNLFGSLGFKETFPKKWFASSVELPFEDTTIPCPVGYDNVLTKMYGNYLELPPEEERVSKHLL